MSIDFCDPYFKICFATTEKKFSLINRVDILLSNNIFMHNVAL